MLPLIPRDTWSSLPSSNMCHAYRFSGETSVAPLGNERGCRLPGEPGGCFLQELEEHVACRVDIPVGVESSARGTTPHGFTLDAAKQPKRRRVHGC